MTHSSQKGQIGAFFTNMGPESRAWPYPARGPTARSGPSFLSTPSPSSHSPLSPQSSREGRKKGSQKTPKTPTFRFLNIEFRNPNSNPNSSFLAEQRTIDRSIDRRLAMASTVDTVGDPIPTSAVLMASSKHIATSCRAENVAFLQCKKNDPNPEKCLDKGQQVTRCVLSL